MYKSLPFTFRTCLASRLTRPRACRLLIILAVLLGSLFWSGVVLKNGLGVYSVRLRELRRRHERREEERRTGWARGARLSGVTRAYTYEAVQKSESGK